MSGGKPGVAETLRALPTDASDISDMCMHCSSLPIAYKSDHHYPFVSGQKLDTEEASKQKKLK